MKQFSYPVINMVKTGKRIESARKAAGYSVKDLQDAIVLESVQAIYKWQRGESLPTVDNLLVLSHLFRVPMESLLVYDDQEGVLFLAGLRLSLYVSCPAQ